MTKNCQNLFGKIPPDINKYLRNVFITGNNIRYSQILIIDQTLKALDLLLKQALLVVFYTQKTSSRGEHS